MSYMYRVRQGVANGANRGQSMKPVTTQNGRIVISTNTQPTRTQVEEVARRNIQEQLDRFLPDNGKGYVNGSLPRRPHWEYEKQAVKADAYDATLQELRVKGWKL